VCRMSSDLPRGVATPMQTRLVLFEGISGSGKSALSEHAATHLRIHGLTTQWVSEAALLRDHFAQFWAAFSQQRPHLPSILIEDWQRLAQTMSQTNAICVLDGALSVVTIALLLAVDMPHNYISQTAHHVLTLVRAFNPRIIHLSGDVDAIVQRTQQARGSAWTHQTTSFLNSQPYQLARGRTGIAGVGLFLQDMQKLLGEILQQPYAICCIDSTAGDWSHYQQTIMSYFKHELHVPDNAG
jgi:adenosyl cobinamide kinase/adenosyl cobinamide phosphate guanylyltransferase